MVGATRANPRSAGPTPGSPCPRAPVGPPGPPGGDYYYYPRGADWYYSPWYYSRYSPFYYSSYGASLFGLAYIWDPFWFGGDPYGDRWGFGGGGYGYGGGGGGGDEDVSLGTAIGAITFTGSIIAFLKLSGRMSGKPIILPARHLLNIGIALALVACIVMFCREQSAVYFWAIAALSFLLGVLIIVPIGGADMPVVISMLNSYSGWARGAVPAHPQPRTGPRRKH